MPQGACSPATARGRGFAPVPYFWSDQYDCKIQVIGVPHASDEAVVVNGSPEERRFFALFGARDA